MGWTTWHQCSKEHETNALHCLSPSVLASDIRGQSAYVLSFERTNSQWSRKIGRFCEVLTEQRHHCFTVTFSTVGLTPLNVRAVGMSVSWTSNTDSEEVPPADQVMLNGRFFVGSPVQVP